MKLQLIRNATFRLYYAGFCLITDPYFADKQSRPSYAGKSKNPLVELPLPVHEIIADADGVLVSHLHSDHFDPAAQELLPKNLPIICQAEDEQALIEKGFMYVFPVRERLSWHGIQIQRIPGRHGDGDVLKQMGISSGFLLEADNVLSVYWVGDSVLSDEIKEVIVSKRPGIIITHSCGAQWGNQVKIVMDEVQTAEVCKIAPQSTVIAVHMEAVDHATVTRKALREYAREQGIKDEQLLIPADGETIEFN